MLVIYIQCKALTLIGFINFINVKIDSYFYPMSAAIIMQSKK